MRTLAKSGTYRTIQKHLHHIIFHLYFDYSSTILVLPFDQSCNKRRRRKIPFDPLVLSAFSKFFKIPPRIQNHRQYIKKRKKTSHRLFKVDRTHPLNEESLFLNHRVDQDAYTQPHRRKRSELRRWPRSRGTGRVGGGEGREAEVGRRGKKKGGRQTSVHNR